MLFKLLYYIFIGYLFYMLIKAALILIDAGRMKKRMRQSPPPREKDISSVAKVVDEKRLDQ